jgi:hypothetical protein
MQMDLDATPRDCGHLRRRAASLLDSALARLEFTNERWLAAGLPRDDA